jgi:hypothetical protein
MAVCFILFAGCRKPATERPYHGKFKVVHDSLGCYEVMEIFKDGRYEQNYFEDNHLTITNAGRCHLVHSLEEFKKMFPKLMPQRYWTFPVVVYEDYVDGRVTRTDRELGIIASNEVSRTPFVTLYFSGRDNLVSFLPGEGPVFKRLTEE